MNAVSIYLNDLGSYKKIPRERELKLLRLAKRGDADAIDELVRGHAYYVVRLAQQFSKARTRTPLEDLIQAGNVGLMEAIQKFDATNGAQFITYATFWIRRGIMNVMRADASLVGRPSTWFHKPTRARMEVELDPKSLALLNGDIAALGGLDYDATRADPEDPGRRLDRAESEAWLAQALSQLPTQQRAVLTGRMRGLTLEAVGKEVGVTPERIRQIEVKAIKKLRQMAASSA